MDLTTHRIVSREEWLSERKRHLVREKELTRLSDQISADRRALPWVRIDKDYLFETRDGRRTLPQLFGTNSQLVIYHFMLAPGQTDGCVGCSFMTDHLEGAAVHLEHHDVRLILASRAPLTDIEAYKSRMGWEIPWMSANGSDFNFDFQVSFTPEQVASGTVEYNYQPTKPWGEDAHGLSVFFKDSLGQVFHTYSSYGRGGDALLGTYTVLDLTPKGRNEVGPNGKLDDWVKRHDEYTRLEEKGSACCS